MMTGSGGWPLSLFLTPDRRPFYGGTYFPPDSRWGRPGLPQILAARSRAPGRRRREELETSAGEMLEHLAASAKVAHGPPRARSRRRSSRPRSTSLGRPVRRRRRRLRRRAEVSARDAAGVPAPALARARATPGARTWLETTLDEDGGRRDVRPGRRRLPPLLGRRRGGSCRTSRRCSTTTPCSRACTCWRTGRSVSTDFARVARETLDYLLARDDAGGRRLLRRPGRRLGRRGRHVLRLEPGVPRGGRREGRRPDRRRALRRHAGRQLRGRRDGPFGRPKSIPSSRQDFGQTEAEIGHILGRGARQDVRRARGARVARDRRQAPDRLVGAGDLGVRAGRPGARRAALRGGRARRGGPDPVRVPCATGGCSTAQTRRLGADIGIPGFATRLRVLHRGAARPVRGDLRAALLRARPSASRKSSRSDFADPRGTRTSSRPRRTTA